MWLPLSLAAEPYFFWWQESVFSDYHLGHGWFIAATCFFLLLDIVRVIYSSVLLKKPVLDFPRLETTIWIALISCITLFILNRPIMKSSFTR